MDFLDDFHWGKIMRQRQLLKAGVLVLLGLIILGSPNVLSETLVWNLEDDFRVGGEAENPNRDQFGNSAVWQFMFSSDEVRDGSYELLPNFSIDPGFVTSSGGGSTGVAQGWINGSLAVPTVYQATKDELVFPNAGGIQLEKDKIYLHPGQSDLTIIAWQAPVNFAGAVEVSGSFTAVHVGQIQWFVDQGTNNLASGFSTSSQSFQFQTNISQGEQLFFIADRFGTHSSDTTRFEVSITGVTTVPEPSGLMLFLVGLAGFISFRERNLS